MKTKVLTMVAMATTIAFTSCNKEDNGSAEVSKYITIDAGVGSLTRATSTAFESGDAISVYSWTGSNSAVGTPLVVDNSVNTYNGTSWTAAPQMLWQDLTTEHYFLGVYPTKAITNFTADAYTTPTDVLVATVLGTGRTASDGIVPMTFDHVMSKLVVNLTFRNQWATTPTVTSVKTSAKVSSTVDYITKTATATGTAADFAITETTANTGYTTLIAPQSITSIVITIDSKDYTYTSPKPIALVGGSIQTVNLIVGRDRVELGSIVINDWTTGEIITGGEAQ